MEEEIQEEQVVDQVIEEPKVSTVDHNWRQAQEVMSNQKREIEELRAQMKNLYKPEPVEEKDEFADADPDDYITLGKARAMAEKMAAKQAKVEAQKLINQYAQQQNLINDETRARSKYSDYDYVVDNFVLPLINNDPALAYKIQTSKNPAETAYKLGKISDQYEASNSAQVNPTAEKVIKNASRPVSSHAATPSLRTQAENYSSMSPQQIWEMSQKYAVQG